jgi:hypothetical protein
LVKQRRDGVTVTEVEETGLGGGRDEKILWISHAEQKRLEMYGCCAQRRERLVLSWQFDDCSSDTSGSLQRVSRS